MKYDALTGTEEEYFAFIDWLISETVSRLQPAKGDRDAMITAITFYLETGYSSHLSSGELVDFFCVDTPSILDKAGYAEEEADLAVQYYDEIDPDLFKKFRDKTSN